MSKVWKWVIGILIGLVVVGLVVGAVFMVRNHPSRTTAFRPMPSFGTSQTRPNIQGTPNAPGAPNAQGTPNAPAAPNGQNRPMMPYGYNNGQRGPMMPYGNNGQKGPMMPYGFYGQHNNPMGGWGERGRLMDRGGFSHFGMFMPFVMGFLFLGGLLGVIVPLVLLVLVGFIFYQLGKRAGLNSVKNQSSASREPAPVETTGRGRRVAKS